MLSLEEEKADQQFFLYKIKREKQEGDSDPPSGSVKTHPGEQCCVKVLEKNLLEECIPILDPLQTHGDIIFQKARIHGKQVDSSKNANF